MKYSVIHGELFITDDVSDNIKWKGKFENRNVEKVIFIQDRQIFIVMLAFDKIYSEHPDKNIICVDIGMNILWHANLPTTDPGRYTAMIYEGNKLKAFSFSCYEVEIDLNDGHVISRVFTK